MSEHGPRRPHPESVVLEIGGEIGALLLYTDPELLGSGVEIGLSGHDDERRRREVLQRPLGGHVYAAAFDGLREGTYTCGWTSGASRSVSVAGGRVGECD